MSAPQNTDSQKSPFFWATLAFLVVVMVAGGNSFHTAFVNVALYVLAIPLLVFGLLRLDVQRHDDRDHSASFAVAALALSLPLIYAVQLVPLPPFLWNILPGHGWMAAEAKTLGYEHVWRPISIIPDKTIEAFSVALIPTALAIATITLGNRQRRGLFLAILIVGFASLLMSAVQFSSDGVTIFDFTNIGGETSNAGFYANRNHFATFIDMLPILTLALIPIKQRSVLWFMLCWVAAAFMPMAVGVGISGSRAGLVLFAVSALISFLLWYSWVPKSGMARKVGAGAALLLGGLLVFGIQILGGWRALSRFDFYDDGGGRLDVWLRTLPYAFQNLPFGTGGNTFSDFYYRIEPIEELGPQYMNQAHNEYVGTLLETGLMGIVWIGAAFFLWFSLRKYYLNLPQPKDRRRAAPRGFIAAPHIDLARAAGLALIIPALHSFVDFPLRVIAMMGTVAVLFVIATVPTDLALDDVEKALEE